MIVNLYCLSRDLFTVSRSSKWDSSTRLFLLFNKFLTMCLPIIRQFISHATLRRSEILGLGWNLPKQTDRWLCEILANSQACSVDWEILVAGAERYSFELPQKVCACVRVQMRTVIKPGENSTVYIFFHLFVHIGSLNRWWIDPRLLLPSIRWKLRTNK